MQDTVKARAGNKCELCQSTEDLQVIEVPPNPDASADRAILACGVCRAGMSSPKDEPHWACLRESIWSEVPAVQVASWRILKALPSGWAQDVLDQVWLDEETSAWAQDVPEKGPVTVDSNGTVLSDGDNVTLIKDLVVKGANFTAKRGTMVKNIRLSDDPELVEGRVNKTSIYLVASFLKKAN